MHLTSLRMLSIALALIALVVASISVFLTSNLLESNILEFLGADFLPPDLAVKLSNLILAQGIITFITFFIVAAIVFLMLERMVVRPLNKLSTVISKFGLGMKSKDIPESMNSPYEIETIFEAFKNMAIHVEEVQDRGEEISRMKSDFISTAAHQLRTPLTGIRWTLEALEKEELLPKEKREMVENALLKNKQLVLIVRTLLDVSAIESGKFKYKFAAVELPVLIDRVVSDFEEHSLRSGVHVNFKLPEYSPDVFADEERIRWVLSNLIENAILYTPKGGAVTVSIEPSEERVFVYVRDTGIGIPAEEKNNIFERFYRGKDAAIMQNAGNGLGLYIARNVIKDHGGNLSFKANEIGTGTTFYFSLPIYDAP